MLIFCSSESGVFTGSCRYPVKVDPFYARRGRQVISMYVHIRPLLFIRIIWVSAAVGFVWGWKIAIKIFIDRMTAI